MRYAAWVHDGDAPRGCIVADISATGARLDIGEPDVVPETFTLYLSGPRQPARHCRVVWRAEGQVGVEFEVRGGTKGRSNRTAGSIV